MLSRGRLRAAALTHPRSQADSRSPAAGHGGGNLFSHEVAHHAPLPRRGAQGQLASQNPAEDPVHG
jgi:hypothetical protein